MAEKKLKRVFAGYYERYDLVNIHVAMVVDDVDTGEKVVLFTYEGTHNDGKNHAISLKSFCEEVEYGGKTYPKFKRCTNRYKNEYYEKNLQEAGFNMPRKHIKKEEIRVCRNVKSYDAYAKDMCVNYNKDVDRYNKSIQMKRYVGVQGKNEFNALKEDLKFLQTCFQTTLSDYYYLFKLRYIRELSVRKCAEELGRNRGSIEYEQKKMLTQLSLLLQERDENDNTVRLNQYFGI